MNKNILAIGIGALIIAGAFYYTVAINGDKGQANIFPSEEEEEEEVFNEVSDEEMESFVDCLKEEGVVIYGSVTCPFCTELAESLGGYQIVDPIYVECTEEEEKCMEEIITRAVPEIQIDGELYEESWRDLDALGDAVGCKV